MFGVGAGNNAVHDACIRKMRLGLSTDFIPSIQFEDSKVHTTPCPTHLSGALSWFRPVNRPRTWPFASCAIQRSVLKGTSTNVGISQEPVSECLITLLRETASSTSDPQRSI